MRDKKDILLAAEKLAYESCKGDSSGHDWWHIVRVRNLAGAIAQKEGADVFICELAALLHDVADEKLVADPKKREEEFYLWLLEQGLAEKGCQHVMTIIKTMSFKGGTTPPMTTLEGQVVQDADRLDAIGAIGIARVFAYVLRDVRFTTLIGQPESYLLFVTTAVVKIPLSCIFTRNCSS